MGTARKNCIWYDQCGGECTKDCEDFSPIDDSEENEAFYSKVLRENAEEYQAVVKEYADGGERE